MKEQKRLGKKGFSLVELIVVIAIMAVLVAVIAPTLIGKIEEAREGTDLQALGEVKQQVTNALSKESIYKELVQSETKVYIMEDDCTIKLDQKVKPKATAELQEVLEKIEWQSAAASSESAKTRIFITSKGKVYVERSETEGTPIEIEEGDLHVGTKPTGTDTESGEEKQPE